MTSRIRCSCGRVYDPQKHTHCPECGAESAVESVVVTEKIKPPPAPVDEKTEPQKQKEEKTGDAPPPPNLSELVKMVPWPVFAGAAVLILFAIIMAFRHHGPGGDQSSRDLEKPPIQESVTPSPAPTASAHGETPPIIGPTPPPPTATPVIAAVNLSDIIASAGQNGAVNLKPGLYQGGIVLNHPIQILGDPQAPDQVVIQSDSREALSIQSQDVVLKNVRVVFSGTGETPAISVASGGELETEGVSVTSGGSLGVMATGNASIKATGSNFSAPNGVALQLDQQAHAIFTNCRFNQAQTGLWLKAGATGELHSCIFERNGAHNGRGAIIALIGEKTNVTVDDCRFVSNPAGINLAETASIMVTNSSFKNNGVSSAQGNLSAGLVQVKSGANAKLNGDTFETNAQGIHAMDGGVVEIDKCRFTGNGLQTRGELVAGCMAVSGRGQSTDVTVRNSTISGPASYAVAIIWGARINLEDTEISGARTVGLLVGDRNGPPAKAEAKHCKFLRNTTGIGASAGSTVAVNDSEVRDNSEGALAVDRGTHLVLTKTNLVGNHEHGICVYGGAEGQAIESPIENNSRGAQSGMQKKAAMNASLTLQNCRVAGNQIFGVGACTKSQLSLSGINFESNKTNIYKESGAIIRTEAASGDQAQASPNDSPDEEGSDDQDTSKHPRKKHSDDARSILRRIFKPN